MGPEQKFDLDALRKEFAQRINALIGDEKNKKNLENFSKLTGVSLRQLSQWRNEKQINWPSTKTIIQMCCRAHLSPTWLLFGYPPQALAPEGHRAAGGGMAQSLMSKEDLNDFMRRTK